MGSCCGRASIQVQNITSEEMKYLQLQAISQKAKAPELKLGDNNLYKKRKVDQSLENDKGQSVIEEETKIEQKRDSDSQQKKLNIPNKTKAKPKSEAQSISTSKSTRSEKLDGDKSGQQPSREKQLHLTSIKTQGNQELKIKAKKKQEITKTKK